MKPQSHLHMMLLLHVVALSLTPTLIWGQEIAKSCSCMKYWQCVNSGGIPFSYCGINEICCAERGSTAGREQTGSDLLFASLHPDGIDTGSSASSTSASSSASSNSVAPVKESNCGKKGKHSNREGISDPGEWSWHSAILEKNQDLYVCGASLLDERWIMTAAHCVDDYRDGAKLKIRVGEHDVSSLNEPIRHDEYEVDRIFVHPKFNNITLLNDIALLRLSDSVKKRSNINIVCLPDEDTFTPEELLKATCFITGWGRMDEQSEHSLVMKEIKLPIWDPKRCESSLRSQFGQTYQLPGTNLCAGAEGKDACDGDGGGPLVCEHSNKSWYQVGIVSFGVGCGRKNTPGVYSRVTSYTDWIYSTAVDNTPIN